MTAEKDSGLIIVENTFNEPLQLDTKIVLRPNRTIKEDIIRRLESSYGKDKYKFDFDFKIKVTEVK